LKVVPEYEVIMKYVIAFFLTFAALGSTLAHAQDEVTATVPFDFFVGDRLFHSGKYTISSSQSDAFPGALFIRSVDGTTTGVFLPTTGENNSAADTAKLVFRHDGDTYHLNEIVGGSDTYTLRK
jgi:hypothetical protein